MVDPKSPIVMPFAAVWPSRTWNPGELVTAGMMNTLRDQLNELHAIGTWTAVSFVAGNFAPPAGTTWAVTGAGIKINRYTRNGKTVTWTLYNSGGSTISGTAPSYLYLTPPVPVAAAAYWTSSRCTFCISAGAYNGVAFVYIDPGTGLAVLSAANTTFVAGALDFGFTLTYEGT